jgi:endo-alpha-1,4-polygalactosaminidase (GH114 family)
MKAGTIAAWAAVAAVAVVVASGGSAPAGEARAERGTAHESFAFAIGNGTVGGSAQAVAARLGRFDLVVVDGEDAKAQAVEAIQAEDTDVIAYLSVGTIEKWRKWYDQIKRYRLSAWQDWRDEWYADTSRAGLRRKLVAIAEDEILVKGFDGLFLDNVDMVEVKRHKPQREGMGKLVADLDELVGGRMLFAQNGAPGVLEGYPQDGVDPLIDHLDGWNREDVTYTYDFDTGDYERTRTADRNAALEELQEIGGEGLITTATDYTGLQGGFGEQECEAVTNALGVGALPYLADIGLTKKAVEANPPADC